MIKLRPHHFMCIHGFQGKGYSPEFVKNFWDVVYKLKDENTEVQMVEALDEICAPCPSNQGNSCLQEQKILQLDNAYKKTLGLKPNQILKWNQAKELVAEKVSLQDFDFNCEPCSWKKLGVCRTSLQKLKKTAGLSTGLATLGISFLFLLNLNFGFAQDQAGDSAAVKEEISTSQIISPEDKEKLLQELSKEPSNPNNAVETNVLTVEQIENNIMLDKTKRISVLKRIQEAWTSKSLFKMHEYLKEIKGNKDLSDYYHFLSAQAHHAQMQEHLHKNQTILAMKSAASAIENAKLVPLSNSYTPLTKQALAIQGECEVTIAHLLLKQKKEKQIADRFEEGFQHLASANLLVLIPKKTVLDYALLCKRSKNLKKELCTSWVHKLSPLLARTEEGKIVEKIVQFKKPVIDRPMAQAPYKVDVDLQSFNKGYAFYQEGKFVDAFATWRDLLKDYPRTTIKLRTTFWMARAAQKAGYDAQAETLYRMVIHDLPFSYYALLSSWFSGIDLSRMMNLELPNAVTKSDSVSPADLAHVKRAETFLASAVPEYAAYELQEVSSISSLPNEFLVYLAALNHLASCHLQAFKIFGELSSRNYFGLYSSYGQKILFPTTRLPLIREIAQDAKVDPLLIISLIKQESAFRSDAVSGSNAFGLMQIIPPTARDLDAKVEIQDLFFPPYNIKLGTKYVAQLMKKYNGDIISSLAAYNSGPGNSDRWLRDSAENMPPEEYIETITFRETREYVQNILRNLYWYNRRIKGDIAPNLKSLVNFVVPVTGAGKKVKISGQPSVLNKKRMPSSSSVLKKKRKMQTRSARSA